jgi:hypothetical protein
MLELTQNQLVRFGAEDSRWVTTFAKLPGERRMGLRSFPDPARYRQTVETLAAAGVASRCRLFAVAQRAWHVRGQSGCQFARLAAHEADTLRWDCLVLNEDGVRVPDSRLQDLDRQVRAALLDRGCEVLSILLPGLRSPRAVTPLMRRLTRLTGFWCEVDVTDSTGHRMHLRYPVAAGVHAWVMAFGPFDFLPNTRRGPSFELVVRTKKKPPWIFHRLNQDRGVAHLADAPLEMSDLRWEHRWQSTLRRTRMILGGEPDDVTAAKATIVVPHGHLEAPRSPAGEPGRSGAGCWRPDLP